MRFLLIAWVPLVVLAALVAGALGFWSGPGPSPDVPTPAQRAVIDELGAPSAFVVVDGPVEPGGEFARMEQWAYPDAGVTCLFADGYLTTRMESTFSQEVHRTGLTPWDLDRSMRARDIEELLGEAGEPLEEPENAFADYESFTFDTSRLVVSFLDGWFYAAQTY